MKKLAFILLITVGLGSASAQWTQLFSNSSFFEFYSVHFLNPDTGFVSANPIGFSTSNILRTYNSGNSWDTANLGTWGALMDFYFINNSIGYVAGQDGFIFKTNTLGDSWSLYSSCFFLNDNSEIHFYDLDSGIAINFAGNLVQIKDSMVPCQILPPYGFEGFFPGTGTLRFLNSQFGYAAGGDGAFAITNDGGATWHYRNTDPSLKIFAAWMTSETHGIAAGRDGKISITHDGGLNWSTPFSISNYHIFDIQMLDSLRGYAVGGIDNHPHYNPANIPTKGIIWKTYDGGITWMVEDSSGTNMFSALQIIHDSLAFAVGYNGQIFRNQTNMFADMGVEKIPTPRITVSPVPTQGLLHIHLHENSDHAELSLVDITGRQVHFERLDRGSSNTEWQLGHLPAGMYFLLVRTQSGILITEKIIKQ